MQFFLTLISLAAGLVAAQDPSTDIPACAQPCIAEAVSSATDCSDTDYACWCANKDAIVSAGTACVLSDCGADVAINDVLPAIDAFCAKVESS
ncbi:hypothetical protein B0T20DRAFT_243899 [Sordaria brevicollis]|uniref:CFEM domain-containing protein n=1 Tax=Sordaria brevicollis TaxID=83679 RepID=A0AAE0PBI5_SORBR|nr:hypothetical protein B0T20DRAFT_243899 [Sordaria brevicollis]